MSARKTALPKPPSKRKHRQDPKPSYMAILMSGPLNDRKLVVPQFDIATLFVRVYESGFGVSGYCTKNGTFQALGASNGPGPYTACRYRRVFDQYAYDAESGPSKGMLIFEYDKRSQNDTESEPNDDRRGGIDDTKTCWTDSDRGTGEVDPV